MSGKRFGNPSLTTSARQLRPDSAEPRLFPGHEPRPINPTAVASAGPLSAGGDEARIAVASPTISAADRPRTTAGLPTGTLLYLALVGLIATATIGAFFGVGFLLLAAPAKETVAASEPSSARPSAPISSQTGTPHPVAAAAIPDPSPVQPPPANETAPLPPIKAPQHLLPASAGSVPPTHTAPASEPAPSSQVSAVASTDIATGSVSSPEGAASDHAVRSPSTRHRRLDPSRTASRYPHHRSARNGRSPEQPHRFAQSSTLPQAGQTGSFDQLLTQLTGQTKPPVDQALTPPPAGQPDPFAQAVSNR
jgi:hypothetical protein